MVQDEEDDLAAEEENKIINEVCTSQVSRNLLRVQIRHVFDFTP